MNYHNMTTDELIRTTKDNVTCQYGGLARTLAARLEMMTDDYETLRKESETEIESLEKELDKLQAEYDDAKSELDEYRDGQRCA